MYIVNESWYIRLNNVFEKVPIRFYCNLLETIYTYRRVLSLTLANMLFEINYLMNSLYKFIDIIVIVIPLLK
jgi:hypothetical protein